MWEVVSSITDSYLHRTEKQNIIKPHNEAAISITIKERHFLAKDVDLNESIQIWVIVNQQTIFPQIFGMIEHHLETSSAHSKLIQIYHSQPAKSYI